MRTNYKRGSVDSSGHLVSPGTFQGHSQPGNTRTQWPLLPVPRGWRTRTAGSWLSLNDINILIKLSIFYSSTPHYLKRASCLVGSMQFETLYTLNFYQPLKHSHTSTFLKSTDCYVYPLCWNHYSTLLVLVCITKYVHLLDSSFIHYADKTLLI